MFYSLYDMDNIKRAKNDLDYLGELITENKNLIWFSIHKYVNISTNMLDTCGATKDDLYQLGCIGFMKAIKAFNIKRGVKFSSFAAITIAREVKHFLRSNYSIIKISRGAQSLLASIKDIEEELGYIPNQKELADLLNVSVKRIQQVTRGGISGVEAIAAGYSHGLALKMDGLVWAWGNNNYGQLGDGTETHCYTPVQVSGLNGVIAISAGEYHCLALKGDGTIWAWGDNYYGQLGDGTATERHTPVQVSGISGVEAIAAGYSHSLALKEDKTVWAWGDNKYGQLGDGTTTKRQIPVCVSSLSGVTAIKNGFNYSFALKADGTTWAWGSNGSGKLGDGTIIERHTPVQLDSISGATAIIAGTSHSLALKGDGTVWAWGYNYYGQLGNGESQFVLCPKWVLGTPIPNINLAQEIELIFTAENVEILNNRVFKVEYDENKLELVDLCAFTVERELSTGTPQGTNITILQYTPGIIRFKVNASIPQGKKWTGTVNIITFKPKTSERPVINYIIE